MTFKDQTGKWLFDALEIAKSIINAHHLDQSNFFKRCSFQFRFDQNASDVFGYVDGRFPSYVIGIHELFSNPTDEDKRFVIMTLVHELLHIIHADWSEDQVAREEYKIANLAGYFDTLQRRDSAYLARRKNLSEYDS